MPSYFVNVGINYRTNGVELRADPGDIVDDLPRGVAEWMLRDEIVEKVAEPPSSRKVTSGPVVQKR